MTAMTKISPRGSLICKKMWTKFNYPFPFLGRKTPVPVPSKAPAATWRWSGGGGTGRRRRGGPRRGPGGTSGPSGWTGKKTKTTRTYFVQIPAKFEEIQITLMLLRKDHITRRNDRTGTKIVLISMFAIFFHGGWIPPSLL